MKKRAHIAIVMECLKVRNQRRVRSLVLYCVIARAGKIHFEEWRINREQWILQERDVPDAHRFVILWHLAGGESGVTKPWSKDPTLPFVVRKWWMRQQKNRRAEN
ncbi:hypothetical protein A1OU_12260 [Enterovibrio norvegicus]|nr:hypothetical protein A1OU_12260 [Enterovibrio norvegicus]